MKTKNGEEIQVRNVNVVQRMHDRSLVLIRTYIRLLTRAIALLTCLYAYLLIYLPLMQLSIGMLLCIMVN